MFLSLFSNYYLLNKVENTFQTFDSFIDLKQNKEALK